MDEITELLRKAETLEMLSVKMLRIAKDSQELTTLLSRQWGGEAGEEFVRRGAVISEELILRSDKYAGMCTQMMEKIKQTAMKRGEE